MPLAISAREKENNHRFSASAVFFIKRKIFFSWRQATIYLLGDEWHEEAFQHFEQGESEVGIHRGDNFLHTVTQEVDGWLQ